MVKTHTVQVEDRLDVPPQPSTVTYPQPSEVVQFIPADVNVLPMIRNHSGSDDLPESGALAIGTLGSPLVRPKKPIRLSVAREGSYFTARWEVIAEFGYGENLTDAIEDFQKTVLDLFERLEDDESRLGPDLAAILAVLREYLSRVAI